MPKKSEKKDTTTTKPKTKIAKKETTAETTKRPPNAYILYSNKVRDSMKAANPTLKMTELTQLIAANYKALSEQESASFKKEAAALSEAYKASKAK